MIETVWTIFPPIITIVLALLTKEVYVSLFVGIVIAALFFTQFSIIETVNLIFTVMVDRISGNILMVLFILSLSMIVAIISISGATRAYANWATSRIKSPRGSVLATAFVGYAFFIDDGFNCLTVGAMMRPIIDKLNVARVKLAYILDATAAPVCIIAPISTWAAAISSSLPNGTGIDGFSLFIQAIPFNYYALLTIAFVLFIAISGRDSFTMAKQIREHNKIDSNAEVAEASTKEDIIVGNGRVKDLILPLLVLISSCIYGLLYTGGITSGASIYEAFSDCEASKGLLMGSVITIVFVAILYFSRGIITIGEFGKGMVRGIKTIMPALIILFLAWIFSAICGGDYLRLGGYISKVVEEYSATMAFLPAVFFGVGALLAFATGTSWGTFSILIPIAVAIVGLNDMNSLVVCVSSCLAGAVAGDHASPVSDTTILASIGAGCSHIDHVSTQLPYVIIVSVCSFLGYIVAGLSGNPWLGLVVSFLVVAIIMAVIYFRVKPINQ